MNAKSNTFVLNTKEFEFFGDKRGPPEVNKWNKEKDNASLKSLITLSTNRSLRK